MMMNSAQQQALNALDTAFAATHETMTSMDSAVGRALLALLAAPAMSGDPAIVAPVTQRQGRGWYARHMVYTGLPAAWRVERQELTEAGRTTTTWTLTHAGRTITLGG